MSYDKRLQDAYKKLNRQLKRRGITLPTDETGAVYRNPVTGRPDRLRVFADFERLIVQEEQAKRSKLTTLEQEDRFRQTFEKYVSPFELEVLVWKYVYDNTFAEIKKKVGFDNMSAVYRTHERAMQKVRERYEG